MSLMERAPVIGAMSSRDLQTLEERQSECAFPVPCSDDTCCPANTQCVSSYSLLYLWSVGALQITYTD